MWGEVAVGTAAVVVVLLYLWLWRPLGYWRRRKVPYEPGLPLFGNYWRAFCQKTTLGEIQRDIYRKHGGQPLVGIFQFGEPSLMVCDPEMLKAVMVKDFQHFHDNVFPVNPELDTLIARNPFVLRGEEWKRVRAELTPAFTSGRMRVILPLINEVCAEAVAYVRKEGPRSLPDGLDVKEMCARYTTEVVSSVAFGLRAHCFSDPNAQIRTMNRRILEPSFWRMLQFTLGLFVPKLGTILRTRIVPEDVQNFFRELVTDAVQHREKTGFSRNDFLQLLLQLKQKHQEAGDNDYGDEDITAHALTFFVDGFETSSVALSFLLHDLASCPEEQERLREELRTLDPSDPEATLKAPFLDACLQETLRLHPPGLFLRKICTLPYKFHTPQGASVMVPEGINIVIPLLAIHTDPHLHPEPEKWRPRRWLAEEGGPPARYTALPFGEGPRQCLGMRFALAQVKLGAAALLSAFRVHLTPRSPPNPPPLDPSSFLYAAKGGLWLHFEPVEVGPASASPST